jgi:hypothetical protein
MLTVDFSDPVAIWIFYTSEDYVPASQLASSWGLAVDRWWVDTGRVEDGRSVYGVSARPWSDEQRSALAEARALAARKPRSLDAEASLDWFDAQWWATRPDQNPRWDRDVEQLHTLARAVFLDALTATPVGTAPVPASPTLESTWSEGAAATITAGAAAGAAAVGEKEAVSRGKRKPVAPRVEHAEVTPPPGPPPSESPTPAPSTRSRAKKAPVVAAPVPAAPAAPVAPAALVVPVGKPVVAKVVAAKAAVARPAVAEVPVERGPAIDAARERLLTVLKVGLLASEGALLLRLRGRSGVDTIYSASQRRFVPLGYRG